MLINKMEKDIETHIFHLTENPQTFKLKNEIKNEKGSKRICVKNIQLEKKFFNIMRETEIEWNLFGLLSDNMEVGGVSKSELANKYSELYTGQEHEFEEPSLQLIYIFWGFHYFTKKFLKNVEEYTRNWEFSIKRIKIYKTHMIAIIQALKNKFDDLCALYLGDIYYNSNLFNYPLEETDIFLFNKIRSRISAKSFQLENHQYDRVFQVVPWQSGVNVESVFMAEPITYSDSRFVNILLAAVLHALYEAFYSLDYGTYLTDESPPSTIEQQSFVWVNLESTLPNANRAFESLSLFSSSNVSFTLMPGYYGIDWFESLFNSIPGVVFKVYKESQIVTLQVFDPFLKLKLNAHVGQLLGLPQDELELLVVYKGKYDIDSIKYLFIHCEQLDLNYNFYDGKSSTILSTRDTDLCNLEVNPTCKRLVDRNISKLTFSLKNDKGRLVSGEGDGILLEVNIV